MLAITSAVAILLLNGCSQSATNPADPQAEESVTEPSEPAADPQMLLSKVKVAYQEAEAYTDNSSVVYAGVSRTKGSLKEITFTRSTVAFQEPNQLHVTHQRNLSGPKEERFELVSNGATIRSATDYPADQIHEAIAPKSLTSENFVPEPAFRAELLALSLANTFPQLALLFNPQADQPVFAGEGEARTLSRGMLEGKSYERVELSSPEGKRVLWIDPETFLLRRMEVPIDSQRDQLSRALQASDITVRIDFEDITYNPELDDELFTLEVPEGVRRVRRFIPPPPEGPPEYLGKPLGEFSFTSMDGERVTPDSLKGKVIILDFWSTICPPCQVQTPVLNAIYKHFESNEDVAFLAVSTDRRTVRDETVEKTLRKWGGEMPVVRDLSASYYHELNVRQTPTMLFADKEGRLQSFLVGAHNNPQPLINAIQRLVDGEDLVAIDREKHAEYLVKYEQALEAAEIKDSILEVEVVRPEVGERTMPSGWELKQLWKSSSDSIRRPGDIQLVTHESWDLAFKMFALDAGSAILELDWSTGKILGRHELPEHDKQSGGFLRTWTNDQGKLWTLASGVGWQQVHVFDSEWKPVLSFPDESHSGIGDVLFDDLNRSGNPVMYVGYWGGLGIQAGTLDGRRLWTNRRLDHVVQMGQGPTVETKDEESSSQSPTIWSTSTRGTLTQLSAAGTSLRERYVDGQALMYFASSADGEKHCGISIADAGQYTAVGFNSQGEVAWEYPLPAGEYVEPLTRVQHVALPDGSSAWLVVAANGSLHWLGEEGQLVDRFEYGEILTGVSMSSIDGQTYLFVSTAESLTAWQLMPRSQPPEPEEEPEASESSEDEPKVEARTSEQTESSDSEESTESESKAIDQE